MVGLFSRGFAPLLWVLIAVVLVAIAIVIIWAVWSYRLNRKRQKAVLAQICATDEDRASIEKALFDAGYAYDAQQNIYYSIQNPWQRKLGYCSLYDAWSPPMGMVFDSEPVRFDYNGKHWLIEFWKGQYGITTGGEIGIYNTDEPDLDIPNVFRGTFYHSASDTEAMHMSFTLTRSDQPMFNRSERHWWLTGFALGEYADPSALTMNASLTFDDPGLQEAFLGELARIGYNNGDLRVSSNVVFLTFARPYSRQPSTRRGLITRLTMLRLRWLVAQYSRLTQGLTDLTDIMLRLKETSPLLYELAMGFGRQRAMLRYFELVKDYLD